MQFFFVSLRGCRLTHPQHSQHSSKHGLKNICDRMRCLRGDLLGCDNFLRQYQLVLSLGPPGNRGSIRVWYSSRAGHHTHTRSNLVGKTHVTAPRVFTPLTAQPKRMLWFDTPSRCRFFVSPSAAWFAVDRSTYASTPRSSYSPTALCTTRRARAPRSWRTCWLTCRPTSS